MKCSRCGDDTDGSITVDNSPICEVCLKAYNPDSPLDTKTLRDEFALAALSGVIARKSALERTDIISRETYAIADAMLAERKKKV